MQKLQKYIDVVSINLKSYLEDEASYQALYENVKGYLNQFKEPFVLCGLSLGAIICLNYTLDEPDLVEKLILLAPQYKMPKTLLRLQNAIFHLLPRRAFKDSLLTKDRMIAFCKSCYDIDFSRRISCITCKTLIATGKRDLPNQSAALHLAKALPHAEYTQIAHAGHKLNCTHPVELADLIKNFLESSVER